MEWINEKDNLYDLIVNQNLSYREIGRQYNVSSEYIRKIAKKLNIPLKSRRKVNPCETFNKKDVEYGSCINCGRQFPLYVYKHKKYCSKECESEYKHKKHYQNVLDGDESVMRANYCITYFKNDIIKEQSGKCAICGIEQNWNNKPLTFVLDHIDGNAANNKRDNLRCICPNCDSQLDTYKSKNKHSARVFRYYKK